MTSLRERYFPVEEMVEDEKVDAEWLEIVANLRSLVNSKGWPELKRRIDGLYEASEVRPIGGEGNLMYQIGRREALGLERDLFAAIEQELRNEQANRG